MSESAVWRRVSVLGLVVVLVASGAGCSGGDGEGTGESSGDPCEEVDCEAGVCESETGECVNAVECDAESDCLEGFHCSDGGTCVAGESSECDIDMDCEAGTCNDARECVEAESCTSRSDCPEEMYCAGGEGAEGTCEPDPCADKTCARGFCEPQSGECVSDTCTPDTELTACLPGEKCAMGGDGGMGVCAGPETFCDEVECPRGVCSFEGDEACRDADDCAGDDTLCLEGRFCNDSDECAPNLCVQDDVECGDDEECRPATGECQATNTCEMAGDCPDDPNHWCLQGHCGLASTACGDEGCAGAKTCEYDEQNLTASCVEPETCESAFDCNDGRECVDGSCREPETCSADIYEPNETSDEATRFSDAASDGSLSASVCSGDRDVYLVDTTELGSEDESGVLTVEVEVPANQRGLGEVEFSVADTAGSRVAMESSGPQGEDAHLEATVMVGVPDHGGYLVEVEAGDDVKMAGVDYDLTVTFD